MNLQSFKLTPIEIIAVSDASDKISLAAGRIMLAGGLLALAFAGAFKIAFSECESLTVNKNGVKIIWKKGSLYAIVEVPRATSMTTEVIQKMLKDEFAKYCHSFVGKGVSHVVSVLGITEEEAKALQIETLLACVQFTEVKNLRKRFLDKNLTKLVKLTLSFGANPEIATRNGETALKLSVKKPWWNAISANSYTTFWTALKNNNIAEIKRLVKAGVDLNVPNDKGEYALFTAIQSSSDEVVAVLISLGANVNIVQDGTTPLLASSSGFAGKVAILIYSGANLTAVESGGNTFLHLAGAGGVVEALKVGLYKAMKLNPSVVSQLVNVLNSDSWTPVMCAAKSVSKESVDFLTAAGSKTTEDHFLEDEAEEAYLNIVKMLLNAGANMNKTENKKVTALYAACQNGFIDVVNLLLSCKADPNTPIGKLNTPVHAVAIENKYILKVLVNHGAVIDITNVDGVTPLYMACDCLAKRPYEGREEVAEVQGLCQLANGGRTHPPPCLSISAQNGHREICRMLLEARADLDTRTKEKESAIFVAAYLSNALSPREHIPLEYN